MKKIISFLVTGLLVAQLNAQVDPTRPPNFEQQGETAQPLKLTAIYIFPHKRYAIIANKILQVGDQVNEFTISTINLDTVELIGPEKNKEVLMLFNPIKTPSNSLPKVGD